MEADFQIAAWQRSGEVQASFTNDSDQLVLGCDLIAQFCEDTFVRRLVGSINTDILLQTAEVPEVAEATFNLLEKAYDDMACPYRLAITYNPLCHSVFQNTLNLGTGTQLLRRQLYYFILKCGNDYCSPVQQENLQTVLRIILGLDKTNYSAHVHTISYEALLGLLRDHGEEIRAVITTKISTSSKKKKKTLRQALPLADANQFALVLLNQLFEGVGTAALTKLLEVCKQKHLEYFTAP